MKLIDTLTTTGTILTVGGALQPAEDFSMQIIQIIGAIVTVAFQIVSLFKKAKQK